MNMDQVDQIECLNSEKLVISFRIDSGDLAALDEPYQQSCLQPSKSQQDELNSYLHKLETTLRALRNLVASDLSLLDKISQIQKILQISPNLVQSLDSIRSCNQKGGENNPTLSKRWLPPLNNSNFPANNSELGEASPLVAAKQEERVRAEQELQKRAEWELQKRQMTALHSREIDRMGEMLREKEEQFYLLVQQGRQQKLILEKQIKQLVEEVTALRQERSQSSKDNQKNKQLISQIVQQIKEKDEQALSLQNSRAALKEEILSQQRSAASTHQQLQQAIQQLSDLKHQLSLLSLSNQQITLQNHKLSALAQNISQGQATKQEEIVILKKQVADCKLINEVLKKENEELLKKENLRYYEAQKAHKSMKEMSEQLQAGRQLELDMKEHISRLQRQISELKHHQNQQQLIHQSRQSQFNHNVLKLERTLNDYRLTNKQLEDRAKLSQKEVREVTGQFMNYRKKFEIQQEGLRNRLAELQMKVDLLEQQKEKIASSLNKLGLNIASFLESSSQSQIIDSLRKKLKAILLEKEKVQRLKSFEKFFAILKEYKTKFRPEELQELKMKIGFILSC